MANQPKKYKKFVATAATATLVASAIVPVASAAGFTDVAGNDHEVAINALADAGIINGYADGSFKPNQTINRGQVVKLLGRYLEAEGQEIPGDWNTKQRFNDLPTTAEAELVKYAALAKDAGVFNGSNGNLNATQTMQRQQMAVVLVRAIKEIAGVDLVADYKKAGFVTEISDLEKAYSAEQRNAIVALEYAGITNVSNFNPGNSVTRGQFASFLYRTIENVINAPEAGVASIKAVNNTTVEVTFDEEVENVQALHFLISDLEVKNAAVKQTNKKVVVLTTAAQTADKEYTVSLDDEKIGTFKGIAAVIPTSINVTEKSQQGVLGQQVTLKAQVTVAEGQSKAGIPVTFNVTGTGSLNTPQLFEATTDENGVASYTYTRYANTTDDVVAYATGDRTKYSAGKVYWATAQQLTLKDVTGVNTLANNDSKVYEINSANNANKYVFVTYKENLNVTADKIIRSVVAKGSSTYYLTTANTIGAIAEYPYEITTGSKAVIAVKLDANGKANLVLTGTNATVTPVVYEGVVGTTNYGGSASILGDDVREFTNASYNATALQASASPLTFEAKHVLGLTIEAQGVANAATYKNPNETGGRDYKVTYVDKDGKPAKAGSPVQIAIPVQSASANVFLVKDDGTKDFGTTSGDYRVFNRSVSGTEGKVEFTVGSEQVTQYVEPIVFIDNGTGVGAKTGLDATDLQAKGAATHFTDAVTYATSLKLVDAADKEIKSVLANGVEKAYFKYETVDQNGKARAYRLADGTTAQTTVTYTVHAGTSPVTVVNGNSLNNVISAGGTSTYNLVIPANAYSGKLEVVSSSASTASVSAVATVAGLVLGSTNTVTATFTSTSVANVEGPVTEVDKTNSIVKINGVPYSLTGATYLNNGAVVPTLAAFYNHLTVGKTVSVTKDADGKLVFNVTGAGAGSIVDAVNGALTPGQVKIALANYEGFTSLPLALQNAIATEIATDVAAGTIYTVDTLASTYESEFKTALANEIGEIVGSGTAADVVTTQSATTWTAFVNSIKDIPGSSSVVTKLGNISAANVQKAIASNVDAFTSKLTGTPTANQQAAEFVAAIDKAITDSVSAGPVNSALDALTTAKTADSNGTALLAALKAKNTVDDTKTNAQVLGLNLTPVTSTLEAAFAQKFFDLKPAGDFTSLNVKTTFDKAVAHITDVTGPVVKTAEYDEAAKTIKITFDEAVTLSGTLDYVDLTIGTSTAVSKVKATEASGVITIALDTASYGNVLDAGFTGKETITINGFFASAGTVITVKDQSAKTNSYVSAPITVTTVTP